MGFVKVWFRVYLGFILFVGLGVIRPGSRFLLVG